MPKVFNAEACSKVKDDDRYDRADKRAAWAPSCLFDG